MSTNEEKKDGTLGWLFPILLLALFSAGVYYLFGKDTYDETTKHATVAEVAHESVDTVKHTMTES